jgi:hypothetical protein
MKWRESEGSGLGYLVQVKPMSGKGPAPHSSAFLSARTGHTDGQHMVTVLHSSQQLPSVVPSSMLCGRNVITNTIFVISVFLSSLSASLTQRTYNRKGLCILPVPQHIEHAERAGECFEETVIPSSG